jgi:uncharacterized damage-inducible protein DinB
VQQWVVASFNRLENCRNRPAEFDAPELHPVSVLLNRLETTMQQALEVMKRLTQKDLLSPYEIQGNKVTGLEAVYHVVEHFGMHYGQILYITKSLRGQDLGFYSELNKTGRAHA